jgi:hypothetical protein
MHTEVQLLKAMNEATARHLARLKMISGQVILDGSEVKREVELFQDDLRVIYSRPVNSLVGTPVAH